MAGHTKQEQEQHLLVSFNDYARKISLLKEKDKNLEGSDIREGLTAIISVRIPEQILQFEGQTKGKLGTSEARSAVDSVVSEHLSYFLEENPDISSMLVKKSIKAFQAREAARKAREDARKRKKTQKRRNAPFREINSCPVRKSEKKRVVLSGRRLCWWFG